VKTVAVSLDGKEFEASFKDEMAPQRIALDPSKEFRTLRITVKAVYASGEWNDTPIAEIQFLLGGKKIMVDPGLSVEPGSALQEDFERFAGWYY
jgi:hypothetical protein